MENLEKIKNEKERISKLFEKGFNEFPDEFKDLEALSNEEYLAFLFSIAKLYEKKCKDEKTPAEFKKNAFPNILKKLEESAINSLSKSCVDERYLDSFNTIIGGIMFYNHYLLLFRNQDNLKESNNVSFFLMKKYLYTLECTAREKFDCKLDYR